MSSDFLHEPPTKWDREMVEILQPIAKDGLKHYAIFYANTFPLAYHYAWALRKVCGVNFELKKLIQFTSWGDNPTESPCFYYCSASALKNPTTKFAPITRFLPQQVFVQKTLATARIADELQGDGADTLSFESFLQKAFCPGRSLCHFDFIEIYAELDVLGEYLKQTLDKLKPRPDCHIYRLDDRIPILAPFLTKDGQSSLRLFIYGGPLSSYFVRKPNYYIPTCLHLPADTTPEKGIPTGIFLNSPNDEQHLSSIKDYHRQLYTRAQELKDLGAKDAAYTKECPPFYSVYQSYNEMALLMQHRSSFRGPKDYGVCIAEHHGEVDSTPTSA